MAGVEGGAPLSSTEYMSLTKNFTPETLLLLLSLYFAWLKGRAKLEVGCSTQLTQRRQPSNKGFAVTWDTTGFPQ